MARAWIPLICLLWVACPQPGSLALGPTPVILLGALSVLTGCRQESRQLESDRDSFAVQRMSMVEEQLAARGDCGLPPAAVYAAPGAVKATPSPLCVPLTLLTPTK